MCLARCVALLRASLPMVTVSTLHVHLAVRLVGVIPAYQGHQDHRLVPIVVRSMPMGNVAA